MRFFWISLVLLLGATVATTTTASAQQRDSVFKSYDDYSAFVDAKIMERDFIPLVQSLGGRDEYSAEQLRGLQQQFTDIFPIDFRSKTVFRQEDLGGGMHQEARAYWIGESYIYFYALTHNRGNDYVVINFHLNSAVSKVMGKF